MVETRNRHAPQEVLHITLTPACKLKAIKNAVELAGTRAAHFRDGAALTTFLAWLETQRENKDLDECSAADVLETFRRYGSMSPPRGCSGQNY